MMVTLFGFEMLCKPLAPMGRMEACDNGGKTRCPVVSTVHGC